MYILYRKFYYKICICLGIVCCMMFSVLLFLSNADSISSDLGFILLLYGIVHTLFYLIKYLRKDLNYEVLRIDDNGVIICKKKNKDIVIPWEKIEHLIFIIDNNASRILIRQQNKETHDLELTPYFFCFRPRHAIKAAYECADNGDKVLEVKDYLYSTYEDIMWNISKRKNKMKG